MILIQLSLAALAAFAAPTTSVSLRADDITAEQYATIMNLAGRQRMLTQKMAKESLLVAADIDADANRKALAGTVTLFETTLKGMRDGDAAVGLPKTTNERILKQLDKVQALFEETKPIFTRTSAGEKPSRADLAVLAKKSTPLLDESNRVVQLFERSAKDVMQQGSALAVVINLSGKQRMLSQKMSKEFLFVYLGVEVAENQLNVRETAALFDQTLSGLRDGNADLGLPGTKDVAALKLLDAGAALWTEFKPAIVKAADEAAQLSKADAESVSKSNVPLLNAMNDLVKCFEKQASAGS